MYKKPNPAKAVYIHKAGTKVVKLQEERLEKIVFSPTAFFFFHQNIEHVYICLHIYINSFLHWKTLQAICTINGKLKKALAISTD